MTTRAPARGDGPRRGPAATPPWAVSATLPARVTSTCLYDSHGWLRSWEQIGIEPRRRLAYVLSQPPGRRAPWVVPLYVVTHSPFWHGYELQAGQAALASGPMVFAGSTYSMYTRRGEVPAALARGAHATAMEWISAGEAELLVVPNLTDEGVASWVAAVGEPAGRVLLDRTYRIDLPGSFAGHMDRLAPKIRRDVLRRLRRAAERGLGVTMFEGARAHELVPAALPLTVGTTDEHDWPPLYDEATLHGLLRVPGAVMAAAMVGERLAGVFFGFTHDGEVTYMCGGVDYATLPELSTYVTLMYGCTEWACQQGLRRIEWGRDNYRFKERHGLAGFDLWALVYARDDRPGLSEALTRIRETMCAYIGQG
jgi:GNAT acetyltransferase-like protein